VLALRAFTLAEPLREPWVTPVVVTPEGLKVGSDSPEWLGAIPYGHNPNWLTAAPGDGIISRKSFP